MRGEVVNRSMIYGNMKKNTYGRFIPICAAISEAGTGAFTQPKSNPSSTTLPKQICSNSTTGRPMLLGSKSPLKCS